MFVPSGGDFSSDLLVVELVFDGAGFLGGFDLG